MSQSIVIELSHCSVWPRCDTLVTHGNGTPPSNIGAISATILTARFENNIHLVLLRTGSIFVLNFRLRLTAKVLQISTIACRPGLEALNIKISSAYIKTPQYSPHNVHPILLCRNFNISELQ